MVRTPSYDRNGMKKGTWTAEEDSKLIDYISKHGCSNWRQLPKHAGLSRCGKSCRLRWMNYLRPNVRRGNYSKEEDELILKLHESLGNRWSAIASHLPGRTDNEIKNHWHASLKNRSASSKPTPSFDNTLKGARNEEDKEKEVLDIQAMLDKVNVNILESSPISTLPQVSSTISSSSNTLSSMENSVKLLVEDDACSNQVLEVEATGDFWTEPFWEDKDIMHSSSDLFLEPLFEHGIFYPPSPLDNEESYLFYGLPDQQDHNGFQYVNGFQW